VSVGPGGDSLFDCKTRVEAQHANLSQERKRHGNKGQVEVNKGHQVRQAHKQPWGLAISRALRQHQRSRGTQNI